ncbi:MAG: hypothetical protein OEQ39_05195 [Gammaproteobacteria bacterium]|nr:hypothetical protein [Gammaproteobacteria bacterium]
MEGEINFEFMLKKVLEVKGKNRRLNGYQFSYVVEKARWYLEALTLPNYAQ